MLKELNDVTHEVITGYSFYKDGKSILEKIFPMSK